MANSRTSRQPPRRTQRRSGLSAGGAFVILVIIAAIGVASILLLSDFFEKGIQEVSLPLRHENVIRQQAEEKGVDAALIAAVIYTESRFVDQTSHAGARGLMQITPETAADIERLSGGTTFNTDDLSDP